MITRLSRVMLIGVVVVIGARCLSAQPNCNRHVEPQGGFSICAPDGWISRERENEKYEFLFGQPSDDFAPNLNFKEEVSTLALSDYVATGVRNILANKEKIGATSIEPLGQSDFTTDSGMRGIRAVFQVLYKGHLVRTIQYYFDAGNSRKLIVTGTSLDKNKEVFDRVFDQAAKSFRLD